MKLNRLICLMAALALAIVVAVPAEAVCPVPRAISSSTAAGTSYIYSGDNCSGGYPCAGGGYSVTTDVSAFFWVIGDGDPANLLGNDSGSFPAIDFANGGGGSYPYGILRAYPGYPVFMATNWASDSRIDGCPDLAVPTGNLCTGVVITDEDAAGVGYAAILTGASNNGDYSYVQPGGAPIVLAPIGRPNITGSTRVSANEVAVDVAPPSVDGLFLDGACNDPIVAYRVYQQAVPEGGQPPSSRSVDNWNAVGAPDNPLSAGTTVTVTCGSDVDVYLTTSIVFDSGFETLQVSQNSSRVECGPNVAEPQQRPRFRPGQPIQLRDRNGKGGR